MPSRNPAFTFRAPPETLRRLNWLAERSGMSASAWLQGAIHRAYLAAQRPDAPHATCNEETASVSNGQPDEPDGPAR